MIVASVFLGTICHPTPNLIHKLELSREIPYLECLKVLHSIKRCLTSGQLMQNSIQAVTVVSSMITFDHIT